MKQIWDKKFLNEVSKKRLPDDRHIGAISRDQDRFNGYIKQMNKMWRAMPENAKADNSLISDLRNPKNSENFMGKRAELITNWVIKKLVTNNILYEPSIEKKTPDFYIETKSNSHIIEVLNILSSEEEKKRNRIKSYLRNKLRGKKAKYSF